MGRLLGIDWDHQQLRLVDCQVQNGRVTVRGAHVWQEAISPNPADPEEAGARLRARLAEAGIAPAPVVACLGRDRILVRDIRYPDVPANEVAALVRFQAVKELNSPQDENVIDYSLSSVPWPSGEQRALAAVLRKELLKAYRTMCESAGLKLQGMGVRSYGLAANAAGLIPAGEPVALLARAGDWAELCVVRGEELLFSRPLPLAANGAGPTQALLPEVRRSLAAYAMQFPKQVVRKLYLAGDLGLDTDALAKGLTVLVAGYDPLAGAALPELATEKRASLAGLLGLVQAQSNGGLPVNFLAPKQPPVPPNQKRRYALIGGGVAAAILLLAGVVYAVTVLPRNSQVTDLQTRSGTLKKQIDAYADLEKRWDSVSAWTGGEMLVLEELFELIARFPDQPGITITKVSWLPPPQSMTPTKPTPAKPGAKPGSKPSATPAANGPKAIGKLKITARSESAEALRRLQAALESVPHWKLDLPEPDQKNPAYMTYTLRVYRQEPKDYRSVLSSSVNVSATGGSSDASRERGGDRRGGSNKPTFRMGTGGQR